MSVAEGGVPPGEHIKREGLLFKILSVLILALLPVISLFTHFVLFPYDLNNHLLRHRSLCLQNTWKVLGTQLASVAACILCKN